MKKQKIGPQKQTREQMAKPGGKKQSADAGSVPQEKKQSVVRFSGKLSCDL